MLPGRGVLVMAWEVDEEQAELKQGKWLQFSVALIYELTCANLSLFGNLNQKKKKKWKTCEKNGSLGHEPLSLSLLYHIRNISTHIRKPGFLVHYTSMKRNSENWK